MERNVNVIEDLNGNRIVFIHDIRFKGKRMMEWEEVEMYLYDIMNIKKETSTLFQS